MTPRAREIELLFLPAFAAIPLYGTGAVGPVPLILFHSLMVAMIVKVWRGGSAEIIPESWMRTIGIATAPLYLVDAAINHAIAASTHLVLFIAVFQPVESSSREKRAQRLLTAALIFTASIATSTHIGIIVFVIAFGFLMLRQLMLLSHSETAGSVGRQYADAPSSRAAMFYLLGITVLAAILFPVIPRVRNPLVHGLAGSLNNASTGLSNTIDFNEDRTSEADPTTVARIWMGQEAVPFFTPLRLRGNVYDRYRGGEWQQTRIGFRPMRGVDGVFHIARPRGFARGARVQQRLMANNTKLYLPAGTYAVSGLPVVAEGPSRDTHVTYQPGRDLVTYDVSMAREVDPLTSRTPRPVTYPITPAVAAMARDIVGQQEAPLERAAAIERYLLSNFRYLQRPEEIGRPMSLDEFLLEERRGHCEYFAAGMVALMTALDVPARIVGGFYGGRLNPLTGYFLVRREDAHAWVEVWSGSRWETYDPTPPSLRPGNTQDGLLRTYLSAISDSVNYFWDRYVLTFGLADQVALAMQALTSVRDLISGLRQFLSSIPSSFSFARLGSVLALLVPLILLVAMLRRGRRSLFHVLAAHLEAHGIVVSEAMTMEEALEKLRAEQPAAADALAPVIALYEAERFSARKDRTRVAAIRRRLAELRT